jgi:hypothetical protein
VALPPVLTASSAETRRQRFSLSLRAATVAGQGEKS